MFDHAIRATFGHAAGLFDEAIRTTFGYAARLFDQAIRATFGHAAGLFDEAVRTTFGHAAGLFDQAVRATFGDCFQRLGNFDSARTRFRSEVLFCRWQGKGVGGQDGQGQGQQLAFHDSVLLSGAGKWVRSQCYAG